METNEIATIGYAAGMLGFAVFCALFLGRWQSGPYSRWLGFAAAASALWTCVFALQSLGYGWWGLPVVLAEWARTVLWIAALFLILRNLDSRRLAEGIALRYGLPVLAIALPVLVIYSNSRLESFSVAVVVGSGIVLTLILISLLEQIYRNLPSDSTSSLKYLCVALLVSGAFDIVFFVRAITSGAVEAELWAARGYVAAFVMAPMAIIGRRSALEATAEIPRQVVLYSFSLLAAGASVVLWLAAEFYLSEYGGSWGIVVSIVFGTAVLCGLGFLAVSASTRARMRVFLTKVFFKYKYDYRKEWLRFISTLSESGLENVAATAVRAVGQIVNSPGGIVCVREQQGKTYMPIGAWRCEVPEMPPVRSESELVRFLTERQWVIDLQEKRRYPARYDGLEIDSGFLDSDEWWLIVPLFLGKRLFGFVCLKKPRVTRSLNFEDHDLLRTVGRHVAAHVNQAESDKRLAESSQFGTYNRLTAFLMHDLNNLIAQQSLVVTNAEKFRDNPKFVDDAIDTIANSVSRMKRLMEQLTRGSKTPAINRTDLREALRSASQRSNALLPAAALAIPDEPVYVLADPERLTTVFEHLIRNAQDATADDGRIDLVATMSGGAVHVSISDTGEGMSAQFIRERLFRPFDSTKGSHAMGIGAYQAREYARMLGGELDVESQLGHGTTFTLQMPIAK